MSLCLLLSFSICLSPRIFITCYHMPGTGLGVRDYKDYKEDSLCFPEFSGQDRGGGEGNAMENVGIAICRGINKM